MIMILDGPIHGEVTMDFNLLGYDEKFLSKISQRLESVVNSGFWSGGEYVKSIEEKFSSSYGMGSIACSSGGMALELVCKAFPKIKKIGVQSNTYFASILPWLNNKNEIVLIGSKEKSLTPSLEHVVEASELGVNAILLTHIGGYPIPEIEKISQFCKEKNILLIEDCAHAPFTKIDDKYVGSFGDASIFSFFPTKPIPAGEGGMALFKNKSIARKVAVIRDYGKVNINNKILHKLPAVSNGRLNEFSASVVQTFLENYEEIKLKRKNLASFYNDNIPSNLIYQRNLTDKQELSFYKYITFIKQNKYSVSKVYDKENQLFSILKDNKIDFKFVGDNPFGVNHICLPLFPNMSESDLAKVLEACEY